MAEKDDIFNGKGDDEAQDKTVESIDTESPMHTVMPGRQSPMHTQTIQPAESDSTIEGVRVRVVELGIIQAKDWDQAVADLKLQGDLESILRRVQEICKARELRTTKSAAILTDYQIERILEGRADELRFDHYLILGCLGEGGMGTVLRALNLNLNRIEALKMVLVGMGDGTQDAGHARERFEREARVLAALDHPSITRIYHAGRVGPTSFIAMEFVRGKSLKEKVDSVNRKGGSIPVWIACQYIIQIADALQHAHEHNVIHRDVKPNNIMISDAGELKVLDLGIARLFRPAGAPVSEGVGTRLTQNASGLGTPEVMSPEQWADATNVTPAADIYSLGCTFFYTLTGRMPYSSDTVQGLMLCHVNDPIPKVSELLPKTVPRKLDAILSRMLAKFPEERFASCNDLIRELAPFASQEYVEAALVEQSAKPASTRRIHWLVAAAAAVACAAGLWYSLDVRSFFKRQATNDRKMTAKSDRERPDATKEPDPISLAAPAISEWVTDFQKKNAGVWPNAQELIDLTAGATDLDEARKRVAEKTKLGRRKAVETILREIDEASHGIPPNIAAMRASSETVFQIGDDYLEDAKFAKRIQRLTSAWWIQKIENLAGSVASEYPQAWRNAEAVLEAIGKRDVADAASFRSTLEFVRSETRKRIQETAEGFLAAHLNERKDVWPDPAEIRQFVRIPDATAGPQTAEALLPFKRSVELLTSHFASPFAHIDRSRLPAGAWAADHAALLVLLQWVVEGREATSADEVGFDARLVRDGVAASAVKVGDRLKLEVKCAKRGYVSVLNWDEIHDTLQVVVFTEPIESSDWRLMFEPGTKAPGRDAIVVLWTAKSPTEHANLSGKARSPTKPLYEKYTPAELEVLQSAFSQSQVFNRMLLRLKDGKYAKSFLPGGEGVLFARKRLQIEVSN